MQVVTCVKNRGLIDPGRTQTARRMAMSLSLSASADPDSAEKEAVQSPPRGRQEQEGSRQGGSRRR